MRLALIAAACLVGAAAAASAQPPSAPADRWHAKARELYARAIAIPTVQGRGRMPELTAYLEAEFRAGASPGSPSTATTWSAPTTIQRR